MSSSAISPRKVLVAALVAGVAALTITPIASRADTCTGGAVGIRVKKDPRLTTAMPIRVVAQCDDATYDAHIRGYVDIGTHRTGSIRTLSVTDVGLTPQNAALRVPSRVVSATRAYAKRHHRRYAYLRLSATATVHGNDANPNRYQLRLRVSVVS